MVLGFLFFWGFFHVILIRKKEKGEGGRRGDREAGRERGMEREGKQNMLSIKDSQTWYVVY